MAVSPARFAEQLDVIATRFLPLPLSELAPALRAKDVPHGAVALTFDDGYRDVLLAAKPQLERRGIPATVFVISGYVDSGREFWWDLLERLAPQLEGDYLAWHRKLQPLAESERWAVLEELAEGLETAQPSAVSAAELRLLAEGGLVEIGAHTVTHPALTGLSRGEQLEEMRGSKKQLEAMLGRPVRAFSYPYGIYDATSAQCARAAGFACACTSVGRPVTGEDDSFELPRLHIEDWPGDAFEERLSDALDLS